MSKRTLKNDALKALEAHEMAYRKVREVLPAEHWGTLVDMRNACYDLEKEKANKNET